MWYADFNCVSYFLRVIKFYNASENFAHAQVADYVAVWQICVCYEKKIKIQDLPNVCLLIAVNKGLGKFIVGDEIVCTIEKHVR